MNNQRKQRRGSTPHREKEIGFIDHQIELSFSDGEKDIAASAVGRKRVRNEQLNEQRAGASSDSAQA